MTAMTGRASFRFIPLKGLWNSMPHPMAFTLLLKQHPEVAYLLVNDTSIDGNPPPPASSSVHQLHINTVRQNFEGYIKNKYNKLRALVASWAWLPVPPNVISKPWYISICSTTALSQTTTFATLTIFMALTCHQSEARGFGESLREWSLIMLRFQNNFCQFKGMSHWLQMSCLSTLFHFWSRYLVALI
jgi:hypothetical protein